MKKLNNKYHSNNNSYNNNNNNYNPIFSLNYKFDSISPAGKCCGTALDLIKKYNDLAKEAHGNGDYVESEVFRQYAEHYRKIVTDINERNNQRKAAFPNNGENTENSNVAPAYADGEPVNPSAPITPVQPQPMRNNPRPQRQPRPEYRAPVAAAPATISAALETVENTAPVAEAAPVKREFKVIEISHAESKAELINETTKPAKAPRAPRRKPLSVAVL